MAEFIVKKRSKREYEQFTCRIESELLEKVKLTVLDNNLKSVNEFINECIRFSLKNMQIINEHEEYDEKEEDN